MKKRWLIVSILPLLCFAGLESTNYWDGEEFRKNLNENRDAISELMEYVPILAQHRILDIGCGSGEIPYALAQKVPLGSVIGIDSSPITIDSAKKSFHKENLSFATLNALDIDYDEEFDTIVSFTTLQLIQDQKTVIRNAKKGLKPGGTLYFQMPSEMPPAMNAALRSTMKEAEWASYFIDYTSPLSTVSEEDYAQYLYEEELEQHLVDARINTYLFPNRNTFVSFLVQWIPHLQPLPLGKRMHFLNAVITKYLESVPTDTNGSIYFPVKRLTVIASKKSSSE